MNEISGRRFAWSVLIAGVAATMALQMLVPPVEVFWSGDGGLKNLMAKQFAHGIPHVDLRLTDKEWVKQLWDNGLHPGVIGDYVYHMNGKYFSVFPYPFPVISAPFYALFGVRGYYIIPIVSLWVVWLVLYLAMRRACISPWISGLLMFNFIFCMPITLYSATFWEHTLGVALPLGAIAYTLRYDDYEPGPIGPLFAGVALGFAAWIRPESMALIAAIIPTAFLWRRNALGMRGWFLFSVASVGFVVLFFVFNYWIYGHPLGTHAIQMTAPGRDMTGPHAIILRFISLVRLCVHYAPLGGFMVFLLGVLVWKRILDVRSEYAYLFATVCLFFPLMVIMVPSDGGFQLGPRFVFIMLPMFVLICAYAWRVMPRSRAVRAAAIGILLLTILVGAKRSAYAETRFLAEQYRNRVLPAFRFLSDRDEPVVALSRVEVTLELGGLMEHKDFFAAFDDAQFTKLLEGLRQQHIDRFLFIAFGDSTEEKDSVLRHDVARPLVVEPLGRYGEHFYCYSVTIPPGA